MSWTLMCSVGLINKRLPSPNRRREEAMWKKLRAKVPDLSVRAYVPFARTWAEAEAYLRRRMEESPGVMGSVLKEQVRRGRG